MIVPKNVLIVDDEKIFIDYFTQLLKDIRENWIVHFATNYKSALEILEQQQIDIIFLDIVMPQMNGMQLAEKIKFLYPEIPFVFITNYDTYALQCYNLYPIDFLPKPVSIPRLEQTLTQLNHIESQKRNDGHDAYIAVRLKSSIEIINVAKISYIRKELRKCKIHMEDKTIYETKQSITELEEALTKFNFFSPHRAFLIPMRKIKTIYPSKIGNYYDITLKNVENLSIPLAREKYKVLQSFFDLL